MRSRFTVPDKMLEQVARRFRYLGEPFRLRILKLLSEGEKSVGELVEALEANQPNVSKHLQLLYDSGLVSRRKQGTLNFYSISDPMIFALCDLVCQSLTEKTREQVEALREFRSPSLRQSFAGVGSKPRARGGTRHAS